MFSDDRLKNCRDNRGALEGSQSVKYDATPGVRMRGWAYGNSGRLKLEHESPYTELRLIAESLSVYGRKVYVTMWEQLW